jgi:serine/threonine-protein kinase RsbW
VLSSRFENIEVAERALLDLCTRAGCRSDDEYWLVTALREALANAIRHGNRQDPALAVDVRFRVVDGTVEIRIEDEGQGFDLALVPDPTEAGNLLRPSGRGIFYLRQFMSRVDIGRGASGGTVVTMSRELAPTRSQDHEEPNS